jgi:hypothetical protein
VFGIFASIAEFERELIRSRVRSGLASAKAKRKKLRRPRTTVNSTQVAALRATGTSWRDISERLGIGVGTACRALQLPSKNPPEGIIMKRPESNTEKLERLARDYRPDMEVAILRFQSAFGCPDYPEKRNNNNGRKSSLNH